MADKQQDTPTKPKQTEIKHRWQHGDSPHPGYPNYSSRGKDCDRYSKPVYTDTGKVPGVCRSYTCGNGEWISKGKVERIKGSKEIIREIPPEKL